MVRYLCRPAVAADRLRELSDDRFELTLKTPRHDGMKTVLLTPVDLVGNRPNSPP